jgi:diaminopimelate epimerase
MAAAAKQLTGRPFFKMSGSGNDFVFFDNRDGANDDLATREAIGWICDRRLGVGADGIVLIDSHRSLSFGMRYFNRDGTLAEMCGNAALCSVRLASHLGIVGRETFSFDTPSGPVTGRADDSGGIQIEMVPVTEMRAEFPLTLLPGEERAGYARVGVPHVVVLCANVSNVAVMERGREIRRLPALEAGANANFVSADGAGWRIRTYERGVEQETLACGTGAVASATLLNAWGLVQGDVSLRTASGSLLRSAPARDSRPPLLSGEGRIVFIGRLHNL